MTGERSQRLNGLQNAAVGSLAGMIEVMIQQPTIAMKNAVQQGRAIPWSVPALYRGVGVSLGSIAPINAVQFAANGRLLRLLNTSDGANSDSIKILCGALSGIGSSAISAPAELAMTLQQNSGKSFGATIREVAQHGGVPRLFRGFTVTAIREALWAAGYLAVGPVLTEKMHILSPEVFGDAETASLSQKASASAVGSILAGLLTVVGTQPVDTVKTVMQGQTLSLPPGRATSSLHVAQQIYARDGLGAFYRGIVPRGGRIIGAVFILGQARIYLEEMFEEYEFLKNVY